MRLHQERNRRVALVGGLTALTLATGLVGGTAASADTPEGVDAQLSIDGDGTDIEISDDMYGLFYEDINYAADGGLYAELVRNRSFEFNSQDRFGFNGLTAWSAVNRNGATAVPTVGTGEGMLNETNRFFLTLETSGAGAGIRNAGFNTGVDVVAGESYDFSVWARSTVAQTLTVQVEDAAGTGVFATAAIEVDDSNTWKKYEATITATADTVAGRLAVLAGAAGTLHLDMVSLFPPTWEGPINGSYGLRPDLAEKLVAMDPSFLRFPGGCVTNVGTFNTYVESNYQDRRRTYQWKETIGPVEERPTNWNFWGYNQTYGLGYLEYFKLAEDLGATALPVLSVGANGCGSNIPQMSGDDPRIERWIDDTVDLIEFANGDVTTEWGAVRAELGHPEPFNLRYIGLGNEENTTVFEENFPRFRDAIEARYPEITIISNSGPDDEGTRFNTLWEYNRAQGVDMVDEHYYNDPNWFFTNTDRYDDYDRNGPHVFLGEYASRGNTWYNGLAEAAYMTGLERNSDLVELASYAPLFANESYIQWTPDAIWFDNDESWGSVNYWVQHMFMNNVGDQVVPSSYVGPEVEIPDLAGGVFLSTWNTAAAYDNLKVTDNETGEVLFEDAFADASQWVPERGTWGVADGEYVQSAANVTDARSAITDAYTRDWSNYTLELDARKISGAEGFLVGFAAGGPNNYFWWNLGGWNNTRSVLEKADGGRGGVMALENQSLNTGQTYRVKVVVEGRTISLYLDGVLQMTYEDPFATDQLYHVVTRDEQTGELIVKVVNSSEDALRTSVEVSDVTLAGTGTVLEMAGARAATNTKANPTNVVPVERAITGVSNGFVYEFPANSITFLRLAPGTGTSLRSRVMPAAVHEGRPVTVAATVVVDGQRGSNTAAATGVVEVLVEGSVVGSADLASADASGAVSIDLDTAGMTVGLHELTVRYSGDEQYAASTTTRALRILAAPKGGGAI